MAQKHDSTYEVPSREDYLADPRNYVYTAGQAQLILRAIVDEIKNLRDTFTASTGAKEKSFSLTDSKKA